MRKIFLLLCRVVLLFVPTLLIAQTPSEIIREAREEIKTSPNDGQTLQESAAKLDAMDPMEVHDSLYAEIHKLVPSVTVNRLVRQMNNFDMELWVDRLEKENDPFILYRGIRAAWCSKQKDSPRMKQLMIRLLDDKRVGEKPQFEERPRERRVYENAVRYLWSLESEESSPSSYFSDDSDAMVSAYRSKFNISPPEKHPAPNAPGHSASSVSRSVKRPAKTPEATPAALENKSSSYATWISIVISAMATGGLLWFLLRRRT
jgi:hypothetical protein